MKLALGKIGEFVAAGALSPFGFDPQAVAQGYSIDSRTLKPGELFFAVKGERHDGHDFVDDALARGAVAALVSRPVALHQAPHGALVTVDDTIAALGRVAHRIRVDQPGLDVVAVTGSTGKTSTKDLLHGILVGAGRVAHANPESYNNEFGLPITLLNMPPTAGVVVTEMGERFPGDIAALCAIAVPTVGVVTNVGLAHAEYLGGPEGAARAMAGGSMPGFVQKVRSSAEMVASMSTSGSSSNAGSRATPAGSSRSASRHPRPGRASRCSM